MCGFFRNIQALPEGLKSWYYKFQPYSALSKEAKSSVSLSPLSKGERRAAPGGCRKEIGEEQRIEHLRFFKKFRFQPFNYTLENFDGRSVTFEVFKLIYHKIEPFFLSLF